MRRRTVTDGLTDGVMLICARNDLQRARDEEDSEDGAVGLERPRKRLSLESAGGDVAGSTASLKEFAQRVRQKVEELQETTCKAVAQALIADIREGCTDEEAAKVNDQNIHRRVYDILNVMAAIGMVEKQKKTIVWHGVLSQDHRDEVNTLLQERHRLEDEVAKKKRDSDELKATSEAYEQAIRAARDQRPGSGDTLALPFLFVVSEGDFAQEPAGPDHRRALLTFTHSFRIFSDADALRQLVPDGDGDGHTLSADDADGCEGGEAMAVEGEAPPLPGTPGTPVLFGA